MKAKHIIFFMATCILITQQLWANSFVDITLHWLKAVANRENINEPIIGCIIYSDFDAKYIAKLRKKKFPVNSFARYMGETEFINKYWYKAIGVKSDEVNSLLLKQHPPVIDTKKLPKALIEKVLGRRIPLINEFKYDETKFSNKTFPPKYFYLVNSKGGKAYLDFIWERLLIMMCLSKDMRFEKEVNGLMSYLMTPNPETTMWNEYDRMTHARLSCGSGSLSRVKNICVGYLNLFRLQRGKSRVNTGDERTWDCFEWSKYRH